jgi:hypothetical protein
LVRRVPSASGEFTVALKLKVTGVPTTTGLASVTPASNGLGSPAVSSPGTSTPSIIAEFVT